MMITRKNAVEEEHKRLGEVPITDKKGTWTVSYLRRTKYETNGNHAYHLDLKFKANLNTLPLASRWDETGTVFIRDQDEIKNLKTRIKTELQYTPEHNTLLDLWDYFITMRDAYQEEDRFYEMADKTAAAHRLEELISLAIERGKAGEVVAPIGRFSNGQLVYERYLTSGEIEEAIEVQKVLNGNSYEEFTSYGNQTGHLASLNKQIQRALDLWATEQKIQREKALDEKLMDLLEIDVNFRKIVANAIMASTEIRSTNTDMELAYRLTGYAKNIDEYREKMGKFEEIMKQYGLNTYDGRRLAQLGRRYLEKDGMLPVAIPNFYREDEKFFYGDRVHNGYVVEKIRSVGVKFVHLDNGVKWTKRGASHLQRVQMIAEPDSIEDFLFNELGRLNNLAMVPNAPDKSIEDVCRALDRSYRSQRIRQEYSRRLENAAVPEQKAALERIHDGLVMLNIVKRLDSLKTLAKYSGMEAYNQAFEEFRQLQSKHGFTFSEMPEVLQA